MERPLSWNGWTALTLLSRRERDLSERRRRSADGSGSTREHRGRLEVPRRTR
jgi:hypothetical protein